MKNIDFNISTISAIAIWLFVIIIYATLKRSRNRDKEYYNYYVPNLVFKLVMGVSFGLIYIFYYHGGDTTAYWDGGVALKNLLFKNPLHYFTQMTESMSWEHYWNYYDHDTGYPPSWIYKEAEGFFVCKIVSIFALITLNSYFATTLLFSFFVSEASWKLYELFRNNNLISDRNAAIAILFIPSSTFWCSGIMKDTIILFCIFYFLYFVHKLITPGKKNRVAIIICLLFLTFLIIKIRSFVLVSMGPPFLIAISKRISKYVNNKVFRIVFLRIGAYVLGIGITFAYLSGSTGMGSFSSESMLNSALVTQKDFATNSTYGDKRYNIGEVDGSVGSLLRTAPNAVIAGLYRPFIWEARSILMLFNGLESIVLIFLTIRFLVSKTNIRKIRHIFDDELLLFSISFALIFAYFVGFTSGLFGTLVRFKAPVLPFFALILLIKDPGKQKDQL